MYHGYRAKILVILSSFQFLVVGHGLTEITLPSFLLDTISFPECLDMVLWIITADFIFYKNLLSLLLPLDFYIQSVGIGRDIRILDQLIRRLFTKRGVGPKLKQSFIFLRVKVIYINLKRHNFTLSVAHLATILCSLIFLFLRSTL